MVTWIDVYDVNVVEPMYLTVIVIQQKSQVPEHPVEQMHVPWRIGSTQTGRIVRSHVEPVDKHAKDIVNQCQEDQVTIAIRVIRRNSLNYASCNCVPSGHMKLGQHVHKVVVAVR